MNVADQVRSAVARLQRAGHPFEEVATSPWVADMEERFGRRLPPAFRCLVTSFSFPEFDVGGVTVFANLNDGSAMDIAVAPFSDRFMSPWLITHHFMQLGRPDTGTYDPVCFDFSGTTKEPAVVRIEHEDILLERPNVRVQVLAESFLDLLAEPQSKVRKDSGRNVRA